MLEIAERRASKNSLEGVIKLTESAEFSNLAQIPPATAGLS